MPNYDNWSAPDIDHIAPTTEQLLAAGGEEACPSDADFPMDNPEEENADQPDEGDAYPDEEEPVQNAGPMEPEEKPKKKKRRSEFDSDPTLSKKEKKLAKKKKQAKKKSYAGVLVQVLIFAVFAVGVTLQGMDRVEAANALIGSTTLPPSVSPSTPGAEETDPPDEEPDDSRPSQKPESGYKYIDAVRLEAKTATDLAVWYLNEFAEGKMRNETEFEEFQDWYEKKIEADPGFQSNFNEAIAYYEAHPELLVPPEPEKPAATTPDPDDTTPTPSVPVGTVDPDTGSVINPTPNPTPSQPPTTTTPNSGGNSTPTSSDKYPHIDETLLNGYTAAQVANWVWDKFSPNNASWDYQALSDYYSWLEEKGKSDSSFVSDVNGYLQIMGWTESAG